MEKRELIWRNISKAPHGEEAKCVGGGEKVNELRFGCVRPRCRWVTCTGCQCVDLAPEGQSQARDTDLGGTEAQITAEQYARKSFMHSFRKHSSSSGSELNTAAWSRCTHSAGCVLR